MKRKLFICKNKAEMKVVVAFLLGLGKKHYAGKTDVNEIVNGTYPTYKSISVADTFCGDTNIDKFSIEDTYTIDTLSTFLNELNELNELIVIENVGDYTATITEKGVVVGCQTITFDKVKEIYEAIKKFEAN